MENVDYNKIRHKLGLDKDSSESELRKKIRDYLIELGRKISRSSDDDELNRLKEEERHLTEAIKSLGVEEGEHSAKEETRNNFPVPALANSQELALQELKIEIKERELKNSNRKRIGKQFVPIQVLSASLAILFPFFAMHGEEFRSLLNGSPSVSSSQIEDVRRAIEDQENFIISPTGDLSQTTASVRSGAWLSSFHNDLYIFGNRYQNLKQFLESEGGLETIPQWDESTYMSMSDEERVELDRELDRYDRARDVLSGRGEFEGIFKGSFPTSLIDDRAAESLIQSFDPRLLKSIGVRGAEPIADNWPLNMGDINAFERLYNLKSRAYSKFLVNLLDHYTASYQRVADLTNKYINWHRSEGPRESSGSRTEDVYRALFDFVRQGVTPIDRFQRINCIEDALGRTFLDLENVLRFPDDPDSIRVGNDVYSCVSGNLDRFNVNTFASLDVALSKKEDLDLTVSELASLRGSTGAVFNDQQAQVSDMADKLREVFTARDRYRTDMIMLFIEVVFVLAIPALILIQQRREGRTSWIFSETGLKKIIESPLFKDLLEEQDNRFDLSGLAAVITALGAAHSQESAEDVARLIVEKLILRNAVEEDPTPSPSKLYRMSV